MKKDAVNVGIIGFGTVGAGTAKILLNRQKKFEKEGVGLSLTVTPCWCYGSETS